jgi:hypothetical protein
MAQLGDALRIVFTSARVEESGGLLPWTRKTRDQDIHLDWQAESRADGVVAKGRITMAEVRWWEQWFTSARDVLSFAPKRGTPPSDPVARLWTPLAGQTVEFFVWPEGSGGLALLALFTSDHAIPQRRIAIETSVGVEDLAAFGEALVHEAAALVASVK